MVTIIDTDEKLRFVIFDIPYLVVKYHNDRFPACQMLYPIYERYSNMEKYKKITFFRIDADENLIVKKIIEKNVYSFINVYKHGLLLDSRTVSSEDDIKSALDYLVERIENDSPSTD